MPFDRPAAPDLSAARDRLARQLGSAQSFDGLPRGLIGAFDAQGRVAYAYPEIAGYWLRWAAGRRDVPDACGEAVLDWLRCMQQANGSLPTRVGAVAVDYVEARYLFDHVMLWDGLCHWQRLRCSAAAEALAERVWDYLPYFLLEGRLQAARGRPATRWSGRVGPFLLKVCARLQARPGALSTHSAERIPELMDLALAAPHAEAHPQLYAIEGLIELGLEREAGLLLDRLLQQAGGPLDLFEQQGSRRRRSDVLAQLLRAGCVLGRASRGDARWQGLAGMLGAAVDAEGCLPFVLGESGHRPTWSALFAEQALSLWIDPDQAPAPLV